MFEILFCCFQAHNKILFTSIELNTTGEKVRRKRMSITKITKRKEINKTYETGYENSIE